MTIVYRQGGIPYPRTFQTGGGDIRIGTALELVGTTLGDSIDTTTGETALTNVIRGDVDSHLLNGIQRDRGTATWQW